MKTAIHQGFEDPVHGVGECDKIPATNVDFRSQLNDQLVPSWTATQHVLQASLVPNLVTRRVVAIRPKAAERTQVAVEARLASLPGLDENGKGKGSGDTPSGSHTPSNTSLRCGQVGHWTKDCPFPPAKRARDDGQSSLSVQAVMFDTDDDIRSIRLEESCVAVDTALGHLRRSLLTASTATMDQRASKRWQQHYTTVFKRFGWRANAPMAGIFHLQDPAGM